MDNEKFKKQIEIIDNAFHKILFTVIFNQPDIANEGIKKLSFVEMHLIGMAYDHPNMLLKEMREYLRIPQTTLSSVIAKLERQNILHRVINPRDMRSFSLELTDIGRKIRETHKQQDYKLANEVMLALDEQERDEFTRMLQKIMDQVNPHMKK